MRQAIAEALARWRSKEEFEPWEVDMYLDAADEIMPIVARVWDEGIEFFEQAIYGEATSAREYNPYRKVEE